MRAVIQQRRLPSIPLTEKANSTRGINGNARGDKEGRCHCGGCRTPGNWKQSFFPKKEQTWHKTRRITSKRERQINCCAFPLLSNQVCAGAFLQGGNSLASVSRGGLACALKSCYVSFASVNETEPGWPMSPWQQAISTSLSATLGATVVCLLVSLHTPSLHHSTAGFITTAAAVALST